MLLSAPHLLSSSCFSTAFPLASNWLTTVPPCLPTVPHCPPTVFQPSPATDSQEFLSFPASPSPLHNCLPLSPATHSQEFLSFPAPQPPAFNCLRRRIPRNSCPFRRHSFHPPAVSGDAFPGILALSGATHSPHQPSPATHSKNFLTFSSPQLPTSNCLWRRIHRKPGNGICSSYHRERIRQRGSSSCFPGVFSLSSDIFPAVPFLLVFRVSDILKP